MKIYEKEQINEFFTSLEACRQETENNVEAAVSEIIRNVRERKDEALSEYTKKFDKVDIKDFEVPKSEIENALKKCKIKGSLERAAENIRKYHEKQLADGFCLDDGNGSILGRRVIPLERVGVYVPGGRAAYPSSVLMNAIPASVAGVDEIIMVTPPPKSEDESINIYAAASIAGVSRIFRCGGAQALAALAFGTETIPKVDKIVGPGNIFVATAKKQLFGTVDIDMIAGPSEICVIADDTATDRYVAADLLSQAEHDDMASSILICLDKNQAKRIIAEAERQTELLSRKDTIKNSLKNNGACIICESIDEAVKISNRIAPEHLELCVKEPFETLKSVRNAGSVFLGHYAPEPLGDYFAGTNHVLPTSGTARFFSPLSVDSFTKTSSYLYYTKERLSAATDDIFALADAEGFTAHANAVTIRKD